MNKKPSYKYCIVPCCTSSTSNTSEKLFFNVPKDPVKRKAWTNAMKRDEKLNEQLSSKTTLSCCEDHFSLPQDMENYWQWKLTKDVRRLQLKSDVIPHIFDCQKSKRTTVERSAAKKRKNMHLVQEAMSSVAETSTASTSDFVLPNTSDCDEIFYIDQKEVVDPVLHKCIQVNLRKPYRSVGINTYVPMASVGCLTSNLGVSIGTVTSPQKMEQDIEIANESSSSDFESPDEAEESTDEYNSEDDSEDLARYKQHMVTGTIMSIEKEPKLYLGLTKNSFFLIKLLTNRTELPVNHIYIVLKKIRLNLQFAILAMDFGIAESTACRIFSKSLPLIASKMQELIVWPDKKKIQAHLPIPFRARYGHVVSIIDCLEIEIEKPSDPVHQGLTWSAYYHCNTLKYLISCTPDGLVSFISDGFGGRASDVLIVEYSGFLNNLIPKVNIMADRGFKNISNLLQQKGCSLIRPPSVSSDTTSTKDEVKQSKRIAALRIHVERIIRRVREFKMLSPHACVDTRHTSLLDFIIIIACGIINLQDHLIKN